MSLDNILLKIEYNGSFFSGWQRQKKDPSVQGTIEDVLRKFANQKVVLYGASRTDAGVHAKGQVANFEAPPLLPPERWTTFLNSQLPSSIRILSSEKMPTEFHAQKMARSKLYEYRLLQRSCASALDPRLGFYPIKINWEAVSKSLGYFIGEKDFKSFQGARASVLTTVRKITRFELFRESEEVTRFEIEGNGFLKQMVRAIIGTLIEVGCGKKRKEEIPEIFEARDRRKAGFTADAQGLCLVRVNYE